MYWSNLRKTVEMKQENLQENYYMLGSIVVILATLRGQT